MWSASGYPRKCGARREPQCRERLLSAAVILCVEVLSASAVESDDDAPCSELLERSSWRRVDHDEVSDEIPRSARLEVFAERIDRVPPDLDRPPTRRIVGSSDSSIAIAMRTRRPHRSTAKGTTPSGFVVG